MSNVQADGHGRIAGLVGILVAGAAIGAGILEPGRPGVWIAALASVGYIFAVAFARDPWPL